VIVTAPENGGIAHALNLGLVVARGKYVARQDADDICLSGRLRRQVDVLDLESETVLVSAGYDLIDARGRRLGSERRFDPPEVTAYFLNFSNVIGGHGQVMFRRDVVRYLGGYREAFALSEDYDLWTRLTRVGRVRILPIIGMQHRLHHERSSILWQERQRHLSLSISRRMLTELLNREITDEEVSAVSSVWRQEARSGVAPRAHAMLSEAYRQFVKGDTTSAQRRCVRFVTARRWLLTSAILARRGAVGEALRHLYYAVRWHPLGVLAALPYLAERVALVLRRRSTRHLESAKHEWPGETRKYGSAA
jgi:GT2 family glycosyltransferase